MTAHVHQPMPAPSAIATAVAELGRDRPARIAAWDQRRTVTFEELDAIAGTLSAQLVDRAAATGHDSSSYLPVIVDRSVESVVALHAAIRAGLPFTPIDDSTPPAMVAELLVRTGSSRLAVVSNPALAALLPDDVQVLGLPKESGSQAAPQPVHLDQPGFVVFTSGSTGRPKGVVVSWSGMVEGLVADSASEPECLPESTVLSTSPFAYLGGLYWVLKLGTGPSFCIADATALDPIALLELIDGEALQTISAVPSLATSIVGRWPVGRRLESVSTVVVYGESLDWAQIPALRALVARDALLTSKYGATESGGTVLRLDIPAHRPLGTGLIPLGNPTDPVRVRLEPVGPDPEGVHEIVITGELALGYLDDPGLTEQRFGQDPDGTRWWRSGDVATMSCDGIWHRVGRTDDMAKIRGKLVEPSEPQRVLRAIPGIRAAVVLVQPGPDGTPRLVGHLELVEGSRLTAGETRRQVAQAVAPHLVPQVLVRHDRLPLNGRGKLDRQALLAAPPVPWRSAAPRRPADEFERFATGAGCTVLGIHDVHPDDDLWELGLDSLAAVELTVILEAAGWTHLEPAMLMDHRTPAALALLREDTPERSQVVWLNRQGACVPLYCIPGGGGTAMAYRWLAAALGADQPLMVVEQRGLHSPGRPDRTVEQAATRALEHVQHDLDRRPRSAGPITLVGYSAGGVVAYDLATQLARQGRRVRVLLIDAPVGPVKGLSPAKGRGQAAKRAALRGWLRALPASTVPREPRYRAYFLIGGRALADYSPPPADFPVTLFHTTGAELAGQWQGVGCRPEAVAVSGDHYTMLEPPHVATLAEAMQEAMLP